ncbi:MAG: tRNA (N6-isopentenyl adenosine(37)-C2)-methylthiotransferase MiaB [Burkholderiaceae bacterium]|nr:tRNA (N6-isopentenyl adenosine(37)-C2)-methylthiotransferase MiaB [Burkholderiaceae bacterium]
MNEYDSDKMADVLNASDGLVQTDDPAAADVILFNTCSVREKAQEKVFSDLGRVKHLKQSNPDVLIGVGGCVASQEGAAIVARAPYVDVVFGPQTLHRLPELIRARRASGRPQVDISFPEIEKFDHLPLPRVTSASASVSIMEGCSKYCSFCVVPYTRGDEFSRPLDDVLVEVADLANQGIKEVTLLGQNVNAYRAGDDDFASLLEYVAAIPGVERIRYTTSHPKEFTQRLIDVYGRLPKLVDHLHLPVQSGSDRVLARMKRGYSVIEYKSIVRRLRKVRPNISMSTDFIVGFPGESEDDFEQTIRLIQDVQFDASFSFVYSRRPGTPAADFDDETPQATKLARLARLQAAIEVNAGRLADAMVGTTQRVLVEGSSRNGLKGNSGELMGRTENNRIVNFAGAARARELVGQMIDVRVTQALHYTLRGELLEHAPILTVCDEQPFGATKCAQ